VTSLGLALQSSEIQLAALAHLRCFRLPSGDAHLDFDTEYLVTSQRVAGNLACLGNADLFS
jgi:hypothetical protein